MATPYDNLSQHVSDPGTIRFMDRIAPKYTCG